MKLDIGSNVHEVPLSTLNKIKERVSRSQNSEKIQSYFSSGLAKRTLQEFELLYTYSVKEFVYLLLINNYDSDEVAKWIDNFRYTRTKPSLQVDPSYVIDFIDETQNKENQYIFSVETKVAESQETNPAGLASVFLKSGYSLAKYRRFREVKRIKFYYKQSLIINEGAKGGKLLPKLIKMVTDSCPSDIMLHQSRLCKKITAHFLDLQLTGEIEKQIENFHFKLRSVDQLKSFLKGEKPIHILVRWYQRRYLK